MSEPASAIVGLVLAGGEVTTAALKLKRLWQQIEDIPSDIQGLLADLDILLASLRQVGSTGLAGDEATRKCLQRCHTVREDLKMMTEELSEKLERMKDRSLGWRFVALKAVMSEDAWKKHKKKLKKARDDLQFALNISQSVRLMMLLEQREAISLTSRVRQTDDKPMNELASNAQLSNNHIIQRKKERPQLVTWQYDRLPALTIDRSEHHWAVRFQTPIWWSAGLVYEVLSRPQLSSYHFRTYNVVSMDSQIMNEIEDGNTTGVQRLFQEKTASPFDVSNTGESLLHYAATHKHPEICRLLLRHGVGEALNKPIGKFRSTPLSEIIKRFRDTQYNQPDKQRDGVVEVFQSYLRYNDLPPFERLYDNVFQLEFDDEHVRMFQEKFLLNYYHNSVEERADAIRQGAFTDVSECETLRMLLCRSSQILKTDVVASTTAKVSLLHSAAVCMGRRYGEEAIPYKKPFSYRWIYSTAWTRPWADWVSDVAKVSTPKDLHTIETLVPPVPYCIPMWTGTPLISMLGAMLCWLCPEQPRELWDLALQRALKEWLTALKAGSVDLLEYGQKERLLFHGSDDACKGAFDADATRASATIVRSILPSHTLWISALGPVRGRKYPWVPIRLLDISIGTEPEDWKLEWVTEFEYLAFEFWELVEARTCTMPGSWVD